MNKNITRAGYAIKGSFKMIIYETDHWLLEHRKNSKLPGYLILATKDISAVSLSDLPLSALSELGSIEAKITRILESRFGARLVYICKWGFSAGNPPHFHIIPLYDWVEKAYANDPFWSKIEPDGPAHCAYITRAFIEYKNPPLIIGPSVAEVIRIFCDEFNEGCGENRIGNF